MKVTGIRSLQIEGSSFIVKVETDAGIHGLGESGIRFWGPSIAKAVEHLSELVVGQDPFSTERLWQHMFRGSFFPADGVYSCAISAIDIALWDIKGKALGMPVYKLLGGPVRDKVVCYPHCQGPNIDALGRELHEQGGRGMEVRAVGPARNIRQVRGAGRRRPWSRSSRCGWRWSRWGRVREAVGPDIQICFDVHTRLDTAHVTAMCKDLEPFKPFFIEDPLRAENASSYRTLARHVRLPIAAGEQWSSKWGFREVIEEELISYARIDLCNVGGLTEALKITHWCETHYIDIAPHNPLGPVSAAACVALCMASTNVGVCEMPKQPGTFDTDLFPVQIDWMDGYAFAPDRPGLGVEIDEAVAESQGRQQLRMAALFSGETTALSLTGRHQFPESPHAILAPSECRGERDRWRQTPLRLFRRQARQVSAASLGEACSWLPPR